MVGPQLVSLVRMELMECADKQQSKNICIFSSSFIVVVVAVVVFLRVFLPVVLLLVIAIGIGGV